MTVFSCTDFDEHEQVVFGSDEKSGMKAIIAVHNTARGPAVGGLRMWPYATEEEAIRDVLRLSRGMTYKTAMCNLPYGGGKSVIIGDPGRDKTEALLRAMGRFVDSLGGRYALGEDLGTTVEDMDIFARETERVLGTSRRGGDPSPFTAYGVFTGIRAAVDHRLGANTLAGLRVGVQGLGHVGYALCRHLAEAGTELFVADIDGETLARAVDEFAARPLAPEAIYDAAVDVFAPCALGGILNDDTIPRLRCAIVAGSANNQLGEGRHGEALFRRGILYAPDYVVNAGGLISLVRPQGERGTEEARRRIEGLYDTLTDVFRMAAREGIACNFVADRIAESRFRVPRRHAQSPLRADERTLLPLSHRKSRTAAGNRRR